MNFEPTFLSWKNVDLWYKPTFFLVNYFSWTRKKIQVWRTFILEPDLLNKISRTRFLKPLFYTFLEKWLQNKWSNGAQNRKLDWHVTLHTMLTLNIECRGFFLEAKGNKQTKNMLHRLIYFPSLWNFLTSNEKKFLKASFVNMTELDLLQTAVHETMQCCLFHISPCFSINLFVESSEWPIN